MINATNFVKQGYVTNSLGYRAPEFSDVDWANSYIIQGCSATFGVGIPDDNQTISAVLGEKLKAPVINLGVSGTGIQFLYMNCIELIEAGIKPKGVFVIWPSPDRFVYMANNKLENMGPWSEEKFLAWMFDDNTKNQNMYHARACKLLWKLSGVPMYEVTHHYSNYLSGVCKAYLGDFKDVGTDGQHWGPVMAEHVASLLHQMHRLSQ